MPAIAILQKGLMITAFVAVMMLLVEVLNVSTRGMLLEVLGKSRWRQYVLAAVLGAIPGCLGAYVAVALFTHRKITPGALVATMIATSGDEAFVMFALFPGAAALLTIGLAGLAVPAGWLVDRLGPPGFLALDEGCCQLELHEADACRCFDRHRILPQLRHPIVHRLALLFALAAVAAALAAGLFGPSGWGGKKLALLAVMAMGLFIAATVPDHFLEQHLWRHIFVQHVPRIFLWTFGVLAGLALLQQGVDLHAVASENPWLLMLTSAAVGLLPESGPHLAFVGMYAEGIIPISTLVANSIVQDGHGMLPLLAVSGRTFLTVKGINLAVGLLVGGVLKALGT